MLDRMGVPHTAYDGIVTSGDVTRDVVAQRAGEPFFLIGPERDHSIFKGLDAPFSTDRGGRLRRLHRAVRRRGRDAGRLSRSCWRSCARATCSWSAPIRTRGGARRQAGLLRGRARRCLRGARRRGLLRRQAVSAALRSGAGRGRQRRASSGARARPRAGDREFGAHRSEGRARSRRRLPVRHRRHPCRGTGRARRTGGRGAAAMFCATANVIRRR